MEFEGRESNVPQGKVRRREGIKSPRGAAKETETELLLSPTFLLISVQHSSFGSKSSVYSKQRNPKNTRRSPPHPFFFSHPSPCTQNVSGTQVCIPPPQASTAPYEVSLKEGVHTHSRERACMFAREESLPAWSTSNTEAGRDFSISPFNISVHSRPSTTAIKY